MVCFPPARVAVAQSSSLSLFTNRDAELEQRAMLLKRLAFTIYSSEVDQYQKYLPDIQGEHTSALHTQCFCCIDVPSCYCLSASSAKCHFMFVLVLRAPGGEFASASGAHPPRSGVPVLQSAAAAHVTSASHVSVAHHDH